MCVCVYARIMLSILVNNNNEIIVKVVRIEKIKPYLPKLLMPAANSKFDVSDSKNMPRIAYDVEYDPDNVATRREMTSSPSPSPSPSPQPRRDYEVEVDPDNMVIRGGDSFDETDIRDDLYSSIGDSEPTSSLSSIRSNDELIMNEEVVDPFFYKCHM